MLIPLTPFISETTRFKSNVIENVDRKSQKESKANKTFKIGLAITITNFGCWSYFVEILDNHRSVLCSFGISTKDDKLDLPSLYWIPKLHNCPFNQRYNVVHESAKCSTKPLSKLLTCILSVVQTGLQSYCDNSYSRGGVNQMWILKNYKGLLEYIQSSSLSSCNSIKTFDFSTSYTTIPHSKLKDKLRELVQLCFIKKNVQRRYKYLVQVRDRSYFVKKNHSDSTKKFSETDIINMLEFVFYWQHICYLWWTCFSTDSRHINGYKLCSSSRRLVPLFVWGRLHTGASQEKRKEALAQSFNFTFHYIDDVLSLNNSRPGDFVDRIYPIELERKDADRSTSYLDLHIDIDSKGRLVIVLSVLLTSLGIFKPFCEMVTDIIKCVKILNKEHFFSLFFFVYCRSEERKEKKRTIQSTFLSNLVIVGSAVSEKRIKNK